MQRSTTCVKDELKKLFSQVEHNLNTVITLFSNIIRKKRNSAIDDKPRDALVQMQWRDWPPKNTALTVCYHTECDRSALKNVDINAEPQKLGSAGTPLYWDGRRGCMAPRYTPLPTCYHVKFGNSARVCAQIEKMWSAGTPQPSGWGRG